MPTIASERPRTVVTGTATADPEAFAESFEVSLIDAEPRRSGASRQESYRSASISYPRKCAANSNRRKEIFDTEKRSFTSDEAVLSPR
jgi:hypothetical protein